MGAKGKKKNNGQSKKQEDKFNFRPFVGIEIPSESDTRDDSKDNEPPREREEIKADLKQEPETNDDQSFESMMGDVVELEDPRPLVEKKSKPKPPLLEMDDSQIVMRMLDDLVLGKTEFNIADTDEFIEAVVHDLDKRIVKRLRKGEFSVQAHLDLHGMRREEARLHVAKFIEKAHLSGWRCVLIVHGRGLRSKDNIPVLKEKLAAWLTRGVIGKKVLAYTSALPWDGGTGAVYVLLRG